MHRAALVKAFTVVDRTLVKLARPGVYEAEPARWQVPGAPAVAADIGTAIATDSAAPSVTYDLQGLPAGAVFDPETLEIVWTPGGNLTGDLDGNGTVDPADRQILFANTGFTANSAPQAKATLSTLKTHADLATVGLLKNLAEDHEGDPIFWRILSSSHGTAQLGGDGQTLSFTPEAGYIGQATLTLQADDGFARSAPIELKVEVSGAPLLKIHLAPLPALAPGQSVQIRASADFADESGVAITNPDYLQLTSADLGPLGGSSTSPLAIDDRRDILRVTGPGPALIQARHTERDGHALQAVVTVNAQTTPANMPSQEDESAESTDQAQALIQPDVYPGTLTLTPGASRQLKVHRSDPDSGEPIDIHDPSQIAFAGTPERLETYLDPDSGETLTQVIPAVPEVRNGTRYFVSDETIASVNENGLISARQSGQVTLSIVHLAALSDTRADTSGHVAERVIAQTDIPLLVEAPRQAQGAQRILLDAAHGGAVQAATGETLLIGAGALSEDTPVGIQRIDLANLQAVTGMAAPEPGLLKTLGAFHLELGEQTTSVPVQLAIPLQDSSGVNEGDEILFLRRGTGPGPDGQMKDLWWISDNGFVSRDTSGPLSGQLVARTASPPYNGINSSGDLICVKTTFNAQTGGVQVKGFGIDIFAFMMNSLAISTSASFASYGLAGANAASELIGIFASFSDIYAINMDFAGAYQVVPLQKTLNNGTLVLTIESPDHPGSGSTDRDSSPRITQVETLPSGKLKLTLDNLQPASVPGRVGQAATQPVALRFWISPDGLTIDPNGRATSDLWADDKKPRQDGMRLWQKLIDLKPVDADATTMSVELDLPEHIATSLHVISVQRMIKTLNRKTPGATRWVADGEPGSVTLEAQSHFKVITQGHLIQIFKGEQLVKEIEYKDANGQPEYVGGRKTDQIAFSLDNRLMFIAGLHGDIHVLDTATFKLASTFSVGSNANITSLAVSGNTLYVAEGGFNNPAGSYRLLSVNIDETDKDFLQVKQIDLPPEVSGKNVPYGYNDMAIVHGIHSYLALTASKESLGLDYPNSQYASGNVFILDLDQLTELGGRLNALGAGACLPVVFPAHQGKGPQYINQAGIKDGQLRFLLSDAYDRNAGLATLTQDLDANGKFKGAPHFKRIPMMGVSLPGSSRVEGKYQLNIQRAQSPALVTQNGIEYALVADYFFDFLDPLYLNDGMDQGVKQMGGKIGIIKDPFGKAEYLGATTPIIDANFNRLLISDDGQSLWAELRYWPTIGDAPPPSGLLTWDLPKLIAAAERNSLTKQGTKRPAPIDRELVNGIGTQVVIPKKYDLGDGQHITSGWLQGMAESPLLTPEHLEFTDPVDGGNFLKTDIEPETRDKTPDCNYGDIIRVDLRELIREQYPTKLAGITDENLSINWDNIQIEGAEKVKGPNKIMLTANQEKGHASVEAATEESYSGLVEAQADSETAKKTLEQNGIIFIAPTIDVKQVREGTNLGDKDIQIGIKGFDQSNSAKSLLLKIKVVDYDNTNKPVFVGDRPLNNPGYHAFKLKGSVGMDKSNDNHPLDVWRVEQRLRYLGYPAYDPKKSAEFAKSAEFDVDGKFGDKERRALQLFEKIVRDGTGPETSEGQATGVSESNPWLNAKVEVKIPYKAVDGSYGQESVVGEPKLTWSKLGKTLQGAARQATIDRCVSTATADAIAKAKVDAKAKYEKLVEETKQFEPAKFGADGILEADVKNAERKKSLAWINAYNAPHWMQFNTKAMSGWEDKRSNKQSGMTSWVYDLMLVSQDANKTAEGKARARLWFSGAGALGTMLNLGINTAYVSDKNQKSIYGDEWLLGLVNPNSIDLKAAKAGTAEEKLKSAITKLNKLETELAGKWDAKKAQDLAALLEYINRVQPAANNPNNQVDVLKDFLAIYGATQDDKLADNGIGWDEIKIASGGDKAKIKQALFGSGGQADGVIDGNQLLIGGKGNTGGGIGAQLTAETLGALMDRKAEEVADWVVPINEAITKFNINTPKRLAAFLANVRAESGKLRKTTEDVEWRDPALKGVGNFNKLALTLPVPGTPNYATRHANYLAHHDQDLITYNGYLDGTLGVGSSKGEKQANYAYSGYDGNEAAGDGYTYRGRGLLQITRKGGYGRVADGGKRGGGGANVDGLNKIYGTAYNFVANPDDLANNKTVAAQSGAWYWRYGAGGYYGDLNAVIDRANKSDIENFDRATAGIKGAPEDSRAILFDKINKIFGDQNSYGSINEMLKSMGISGQNKKDYNTQFGVSLNKKTLQEIVAKVPLMADFILSETPGVSSKPTLLEQVQNDFDISPGETSMLILDMPNPPVQQSVVVAEFRPDFSKSNIEEIYGSMGVCRVIPEAEYIDKKDNSNNYHYDIYPATNANNIFSQGRGMDPLLDLDYSKAKITVLQTPKHGTLGNSSKERNIDMSYRPNFGYVGQDKIVFLVDIEGYKIKVVYFIKVVKGDPKTILNNYYKYCEPESWRISTLNSSILSLTIMIQSLAPEHESRAMGDDVQVGEGGREVD